MGPKLSAALGLSEYNTTKLKTLEMARDALARDHTDAIMGLVVVTIEIMSHRRKSVVHGDVVKNMLNISDKMWQSVLMNLEELAPEHFLALTTPQEIPGVH